jgi:hypothetical protein
VTSSFPDEAGQKVLTIWVRRRWELNPQDPGRESVAYKATGLNHMPNFSVPQWSLYRSLKSTGRHFEAQ